MAATMEYRYEVLAQRSEALRIIFESLPWGVIVANLEGRLLFSNPAAERILGIGNVEVLPDHSNGTSIRRHSSEKRLSKSLFSCATHNRVPEFWIRVNAWPLKDSAGMVSGGVVIFHDFTQGRNAL